MLRVCQDIKKRPVDGEIIDHFHPFITHPKVNRSKLYTITIRSKPGEENGVVGFIAASKSNPTSEYQEYRLMLVTYDRRHVDEVNVMVWVRFDETMRTVSVVGEPEIYDIRDPALTQYYADLVKRTVAKYSESFHRGNIR